MKLQAFILGLLLLPAPAFASAGSAVCMVRPDDAGKSFEIKGTVTDEEGKPLVGAGVAVVGTTIGAVTGGEGHFVIRLREEEPCRLRVTYVGYTPYYLDVTPGSGVEKVRLKQAPNELSEVVVTGMPVARPLKEVPVLTRVISGGDIKALNPPDIETLLQYQLPGLTIGYNSMSQLPRLTYQGMGGEYLLFLVDGERISGEGSDHNPDLTRFNIEDIERIEVVRGAQSTLYGSNALGGVINIITKSSRRPLSGSVVARYAGLGGQRYNASFGINRSNISTYTSLSYRTMPTYTIADSKGSEFPVVDEKGKEVGKESSEPMKTNVYGYKGVDFMQKVGYSFSECLRIDLKGTYYRNKRDVKEGRLVQDTFEDVATSGRLTFLPRKGRKLEASYTYDDYRKHQWYYKSGRRTTDYRNRRHLPRISYAAEVGDHTISTGVEGDIEQLKHYMFKDTSMVSNGSYALFLQEDWKVTPRFEAIAGVRADYHRKYHWHLTPKISLMWTPLEWLTVRGGYAQGFRSPSLKELYQEYDMGGLGWFTLHGNSALKPETSNQWSLSGEITHEGLNASLSLSHNVFRDKISYRLVGDGTMDQEYVNAETAKTTTAEAIVSYRTLWGLVLNASYAYTQDYEEVDGHNTSTVRPHMVLFGSSYRKNLGKGYGLNATLNARWESPLSTFYRTPSEDKKTFVYVNRHFDSRLIASLNVGGTFPRGISLNLGIDNLFNHHDKASESTFQLPQRGITGLVTLRIDLADLLGK